MIAVRRSRRVGARKRPASFAWLAAVIALVGLFGRFFEPILVDHTICEHGEITHREVARTAEGSRRGARDDGHRPAGERGDQHEHCDVLASRHLAPSSVALVAPASLLLEIPYLVRLPSTPLPRVTPLDLAPKTSPPAA